MQIADFWQMSTFTLDAPDHPITRSAWGWSDRSREDAMRVGLERAELAARRTLERRQRNPQRGDQQDWYAYGQRVLPEIIIQRLHASDGSLVGAITRNRYGALILNTPSVAILDVDLPKPKPGFLGIFGARKPEAIRDQRISAINDWVRGRAGRGARVYQTARGLRHILLGETLDPAGPAARSLIKPLHVDPLYAKLCVAQACYRARLTPKPWRIGMSAPSGVPSDEQAADLRLPSDAWLTEYESASKSVAVCTLIDTVGAKPVSEAERVIVEAHDSVALGATGTALA